MEGRLSPPLTASSIGFDPALSDAFTGCAARRVTHGFMHCKRGHASRPRASVGRYLTTSSRIDAGSAAHTHAVGLTNVLTEQPPTCRLAHLLGQLLELFEIVARMVRVGEIGGPEEALRAVEVGERRDRPLVGLARDPTLAPEVRAR